MAPLLDAQSHKRQLELYVFQPNSLLLTTLYGPIQVLWHNPLKGETVRLRSTL